jgi:hypothetical protein
MVFYGVMTRRSGQPGGIRRLAARVGCCMAAYVAFYWLADPAASVRVGALFAEALGFGVAAAAAIGGMGHLRSVFAFGQPRDRNPGETRWARRAR